MLRLFQIAQGGSGNRDGVAESLGSRQRGMKVSDGLCELADILGGHLAFIQPFVQTGSDWKLSQLVGVLDRGLSPNDRVFD